MMRLLIKPLMIWNERIYVTVLLCTGSYPPMAFMNNDDYKSNLLRYFVITRVLQEIDRTCSWFDEKLNQVWKRTDKFGLHSDKEWKPMSSSLCLFPEKNASPVYGPMSSSILSGIYTLWNSETVLITGPFLFFFQVDCLDFPFIFLEFTPCTSSLNYKLADLVFSCSADMTFKSNTPRSDLDLRRLRKLKDPD